MATKLMMIDLQHPRINQALEVILTIQYTSIDGNVMVYTIVGQKDVDKMQQYLMGQMNNLSVS